MNGYDISTIMGVIPPSIKDFGVLVIVLSLVEIAPVKVNPWKWLKSVVCLPQRLEKLETDFNDDRAFRWRQMIKNYTRQLERGEKFRESEWVEILDTTKRYETYCEKHPDFKNGYIPDCIEFIRYKHKEVLKTGDYAPELKKEMGSVAV